MVYMHFDLIMHHFAENDHISSGTGYRLIEVHNVSCTLRSVDSVVYSLLHVDHIVCGISSVSIISLGKR